MLMDCPVIVEDAFVNCNCVAVTNGIRIRSYPNDLSLGWQEGREKGQ